MIELTLEMALKAAEAARARAAELDVSLSVVVVDEAGRIVLAMRGERVGFLTVDFAQAKAVAASSFRRPTRSMAEAFSNNPAFWTSALHGASTPFMPATGAVPIVRDGRVIGAIGCGGATPDQDHECAELGAQAAVA